MATGDLLNFLGNTEKFEKSENKPKVGDVFLWVTINEKGEKTDGHTGVVTGVDGDKITTAEANSTKLGVVKNYKRNLSDFTSHAGWRGFYRPKSEGAAKKGGADTKKETSQERFKRIMDAAADSMRRSRATLEKTKKMEEEENRKKPDGSD